MQSLKQVLSIYLHKTGLAKGVAQNSAIHFWDDVVGKAVANNTTAESVEYGVLSVKTSTPAWRQELLFQKEEILVKLNKRIGKNIITDIQFL